MKPQADERERHPLRESLIRALIPLSVDAAGALVNLPKPMRVLLPTAVGAGMAAYDAPQGEKLIRAGASAAGSLAGGALASVAHNKLRDVLRPAVSREVNIPEEHVDRDSTVGGRLAMMGYSSDGRTLLGLGPGVASRAAANALADYLIRRQKKQDGGVE